MLLIVGGEGDRIWRGGIAIEMEGDRDRVSIKFKKVKNINIYTNGASGNSAPLLV